METRKRKLLEVIIFSIPLFIPISGILPSIRLLRLLQETLKPACAQEELGEPVDNWNFAKPPSVKMNENGQYVATLVRHCMRISIDENVFLVAIWESRKNIVYGNEC